MKKIICFVLVVLTLISLCACNEEESSVADISDTSVEQSSDDFLYSPVINGTDLKDFTIVYAETKETAKFRTAANALKDMIKDIYDIDLKVVSESTAETEYEIIVGLSAKRSADDSLKTEYGYGEYIVDIKGTKLVIASAYASGCYQGVEALVEKFTSSNDGVFGEQSFTGEGKVLKVACVGDSITQGINSSDPDEYTYPCFIQEMLGLDYYVINAGLSGLSICKNDDLAYIKHPAYNQAKALAPDVIIFALGTNDANPKIEKYPYKNWEDPNHDRAAEFLLSSRMMLNSFKQWNSDVQIFLVYPPSLFVVGEDNWRAEPWTETIVTYVRPLLEQIADEYSLPTVDLFDWSKEHSEVFVDGLHPYDQSYKTLAQYIYDNIKDEIKQP